MFVVVEAVDVEVDPLICVVTDNLADAFIGVYNDILLEVGVSDVEIIVVSAAVIALKFAVPVPCAVDVLRAMLVGVLVDILAGVLPGLIICLVFSIDVEVLPEVSVNVLAAVATGDIAMSAPLENLLILCRAVFSCWSRLVLECSHVLQAWIPSDHV